MRTAEEKEYLIRALDAFRRQIIVISVDHRILAANRYAQQRFQDDIVGKTCYEVLWQCERPCRECPIDDIIQNKEPALIHKTSFLTLKKNYCHYFYPLLEGDDVDAVVMLDFDIPLLEGLEEKLRRSNAFLRNLMLSSVDAVIAADRKGKVFIFNEAAAETTGYTVEEGLYSLMIYQIYPQEDGARDIMRKLRSEDYGGPGKLKSYQVDIQRKDGEIIPISLNASIVYEGSTEVATIGFFRDLREEIRMRKNLERTRLQLQQADKMASLGKLSAGVAHQLNNPLGSITLFTKLVLEEYDLEDGAREDLNRILKDAQRCRDTVKELLEFARQTRYQIKPHDINQAISRTLFLLDKQTLFHNIEVEKDLDEGIPEVPGDIQQLNHLFMNLIINAAQAMGGKGTLTLRTRKSDEDHVRIEIADTGPGISEEVLPHIFDPFFTTKEEGEGTGLGLSLAYSIVNHHGGTIEARNRPDGGALFGIDLPLTHRNEGEERRDEDAHIDG